MKKIIFTLFLLIPCFSQAACRLEEQAKLIYSEFQLEKCKESPTSYCVQATTLSGKTYSDPQAFYYCNEIASICMAKGSEFDLSFYRPYDGRNPDFPYSRISSLTFSIRKHGEETLLATCD